MLCYAMQPSWTHGPTSLLGTELSSTQWDNDFNKGWCGSHAHLPQLGMTPNPWVRSFLFKQSGQGQLKHHGSLDLFARTPAALSRHHIASHHIARSSLRSFPTPLKMVSKAVATTILLVACLGLAGGQQGSHQGDSLDPFLPARIQLADSS